MVYIFSGFLEKKKEKELRKTEELDRREEELKKEKEIYKEAKKKEEEKEAKKKEEEHRKFLRKLQEDLIDENDDYFLLGCRLTDLMELYRKLGELKNKWIVLSFSETITPEEKTEIKATITEEEERLIGKIFLKKKEIKENKKWQEI